MTEWVYYLRRKNALFYVDLMCITFGKMMHETLGIGFNHQLSVYKDSEVTKYKPREDLDAIREYVLKCPAEKLRELAQTGLNMLDAEKRLVHQIELMSPEEIIKGFEGFFETIERIFLYCSSIPFIVQDIRQDIDEFETLRKSSRNGWHEGGFRKIWEAAASKFGHDAYYYSYFTADELRALFKGQRGPSESDIEKRKEYCVLEDGVVSYSPIDMKQGYTTGDLKGTTAYPGNVVGVVCIVNKPYEMHKFKEGYILVSVNAPPTITPIIEKASAILTDEGGMACHASIISRELKIPCIVGLKHATRILKDGDTVEIDAGNGIVKKI